MKCKTVLQQKSILYCHCYQAEAKGDQVDDVIPSSSSSSTLQEVEYLYCSYVTGVEMEV